MIFSFLLPLGVALRDIILDTVGVKQPPRPSRAPHIKTEHRTKTRLIKDVNQKKLFCVDF